MTTIIRHRSTGETLFSHDGTLTEAVKAAVAQGVSLAGANLAGANLIRANLTRANMADADLTNADLTGANLTGVDLSEADLLNADLTGADLTGANLTETDLTEANLTGANLTGANLTGADLTGANLTETELTEANLFEAGLYGANLTGAKFDSMYEGLDKLCSVADVLEAIEQNLESFDMRDWHRGKWHNGAVHANLCNTVHCIAGHAHIICALERPELLDPKVNVYLVGLFALGEEAASHFFDSNEDALKWMRKTVNELQTEKA